MTNARSLSSPAALLNNPASVSFLPCSVRSFVQLYHGLIFCSRSSIFVFKQTFQLFLSTRVLQNDAFSSGSGSLTFSDFVLYTLPR